eukprot:5408296-Alexandrium_andersonii.AAC.1
MSASLVGSEMCIRDRSKASDHVSRVPTPSRVEHSVPPSAYDKEDTPLVAVSYTHLTLPTICSV